MAQYSGTADRRWTAQLPWLLPPVVEIPVVAALCSSLAPVGREAVFGTPGSQAALLVAFLAAVAGFAATVRGVRGVTQALVGGGLAVTAGVVAALAAGFLAGSYPLLGLLTAHAALSVAMLARGALSSPEGSAAGR
ncbi:hypothetical protein AB0J80_33540 [Actinoplanes sp. NPDC049548]|uniref:hypothetical protein n=1 Tax=Actinoplanes sp. NPDC049548 TaxID=3155152 RepID=UPI00342EF862